jgi:hypothetical protein
MLVLLHQCTQFGQRGLGKFIQLAGRQFLLQQIQRLHGFALHALHAQHAGREGLQAARFDQRFTGQAQQRSRLPHSRARRARQPG